MKSALTNDVQEIAGEDGRLVAAVLRKDRKATARFVDAHADVLYSYVRHRLTPRMDLVDDLVQDVFLAAWKTLNEFRGESSLRSWLLGIARHKVEDHYRARLREPDALEDDVAYSPAMPAAGGLDELLDRERVQYRAIKVLERLPERYAAALLWRYWEKRSARDMALETGRTEKGVERLLARAREQFRKMWEENVCDDDERH